MKTNKTDTVWRQKRLTHWFLYGEVGTSSREMARAIFADGTTSAWSSPPCDPSDFRRCALFVEAVGNLSLEEWQKIAAISDAWKRLVVRWSEMMALLEEECPGWRCPHPSGLLPKLYALMKEICDGGQTP
jgi:hypothetical protein